MPRPPLHSFSRTYWKLSSWIDPKRLVTNSYQPCSFFNFPTNSTSFMHRTKPGFSAQISTKLNLRKPNLKTAFALDYATSTKHCFYPHRQWWNHPAINGVESQWRSLEGRAPKSIIYSFASTDQWQRMNLEYFLWMATISSRCHTSNWLPWHGYKFIPMTILCWHYILWISIKFRQQNDTL